MKYVLILLAALLGGCASQLAPLAAPARPAQAEQQPFSLNGRLSVRHDGDRSSIGVRWTHLAEADEILLLAPLGQTVASIHRDSERASLDTPDRHYEAQDAEALMEQVLGWHLPLSGLHYWVLALPAPGSPSTVERTALGQLGRLRQGGWDILYTRFAGEVPASLPLRMTMRHDDLELQLLIDEWEWSQP